MTMLLAHPEAEDLGRFVEGTLDDRERVSIVQHIADCDDCRMLIVDSAEFIEPSVTQSPRYWWMAVAAMVVIVLGVGTFTYHEWHYPLTKVSKAYGELKNRPLEERLSRFPYVPHFTMRGAPDEEDSALLLMQAEAAAAAELQGNDAKTLHARGVGLLLDGALNNAIPFLQTAVAKEPHNPEYLNDLAAALIESAKRDQYVASAYTSPVDTTREYVPLKRVPKIPPKLQRAITICDEVIRINPPAPEALFNRAKAMEVLGNREEIIKAYDRYLAVDSSSGWAKEIRQSRTLLLDSPA